MRVPRTFLFVDLTGFTNYTAAHGDDASGQLLSRFRAITREVASNRGVRIAKWLGDGAMIVALDLTDAIATALELEHRTATTCAPLALRAGISSGYALLFEGDDYIGTAVNTAARLSDAAGPHEVLLPADQALVLPHGVEANPHDSIDLRGLGPTAVVELSGEVAPFTDHDTGELWTRSPLFG